MNAMRWSVDVNATRDSPFCVEAHHPGEADEYPAKHGHVASDSFHGLVHTLTVSVRGRIDAHEPHCGAAGRAGIFFSDAFAVS
jgi:hypothetical protein